MGFAGSLPILPVFTGARFDFSPLESWSPLLFPYFNPETLASGTSKFMCASIFVPLPQYMSAIFMSGPRHAVASPLVQLDFKVTHETRSATPLGGLLAWLAFSVFSLSLLTQIVRSRGMRIS